MTEDKAREILKEAYREVNWLNLARVLQTLGDLKLGWFKFDNSLFRPNYSVVAGDMKYLEENWQNILEALKWLKDNRKKK